MDSVLKTIGTVVLASILIAIPILLTISFIYSWYGFIKLILIFLTFGLWYFIAWTLAELS